MKSRFSLILGLLLIAVAIIFILSAVGMIPVQCRKVVASWQALIAFVGVASLVMRHYINALLFLIVGTYFLTLHISSVYGL